MFRSRSSLACVLALSLSSVSILHASAAPAVGENPAYILVSAPLFIDAKTAVPGHTLEPGTYSIRIVDHLKDRYILRVDNDEGKALATFIGLHNPEFDPFVALHHQGPILWTGAPKGAAAMRGFAFPNGNTLEFVYPKGEAVALAKLNSNSVPAIDPESEGRKPDPKLSPEDREVVTLWMLTATRVGQKEETPAIEAKRFVAPPEQSATTQIARSEPPEELTPSRAIAAQPITTPARVSKVKTQPVATHLPQTGSNLPLIALLSAMMLFAAGLLRFARGRV
jgi:LPXTG-motif cell wall-anchored protein